MSEVSWRRLNDVRFSQSLTGKLDAALLFSQIRRECMAALHERFHDLLAA
jgi:hypothetical protein